MDLNAKVALDWGELDFRIPATLTTPSEDLTAAPFSDVTIQVAVQSDWGNGTEGVTVKFESTVGLPNPSARTDVPDGVRSCSSSGRRPRAWSRSADGRLVEIAVDLAMKVIQDIRTERRTPTSNEIATEGASSTPDHETIRRFMKQPGLATEDVTPDTVL